LEYLGSRGGFFDEGRDVEEGGAVGGGDVVIDCGEGAVGTADDAVGEAEAFEGLGGGDFVD